MTQQSISLALEERTAVRKRLRGLRSQGMVPAVIHNHGGDSLHVAGEYSRIAKTFSKAGKHHPVQLTIGSQKHLALIKDVDFGPVKHDVRHVVFQAIRQNEAVDAEVPVVFAEVDIPAEKVSLMVLKQLDTVQVKALPRDLPDELVVDPSALEAVGDSLTVADITAPKGVEILTDADQVIAIVEMPKDQIAEANAAAEALAEDAGKPEAETKVEAEAPAEEKDTANP